MAAMLASPSGTVMDYLLIGGVLSDAFAIFAAWRDARALRAAGEPVSGGLAWWCLLVPWAYLWARAVKRANKTSGDWALLAGAAAAWLVVIVISTPVIDSVITNSETFNQAHVQAQIASSIKSQTGEVATVQCPQDPPLNPGSQFQCVATAADGSTAMVTVTVQDRSGDITWQTRG